MPDFPLVQGGKILCLACQEEGSTFYAKRITAKHLIGKHKSLFPNIKTAITEYRQRYPEGDIAVNNRSRTLANNAVPTTTSPGTTKVPKEFLDWERQNKQLFDELEKVKKDLEETEDPIQIKKLKLRKDLISGQQKVIKEVTPARGSFTASDKSNAKMNPLQIKALQDITPLLAKIADNLGCLREVDESVEKCLS